MRRPRWRARSKRRSTVGRRREAYGRLRRLRYYQFLCAMLERLTRLMQHWRVMCLVASGNE